MPRTSRSKSPPESQLRPESEKNTKGKTLIIAVGLIALVANTFVLLCSYDVSFGTLISTMESSETSQVLTKFAADDKTNHRLLNTPSTEGAEIMKTTKTPLAATEGGMQEDASSSSKTMENTTDFIKKSSMMVIASYPKSSREYAVMWSQLECLAKRFDQIIIAADHQFKNTVDGFVNEVKDTLPEVGSKLKAQYHINNRYDAGLWCDVLLQENIVKEEEKEVVVTTGELLEGKNVSSPQTLHSVVSKNASSAFDRFVLINDSMMALEKSNELLESLEVNKNTNFVSLNYWFEKNITEGIGHYFLESAARAFNLEGLEVFANYVCTLPQINKKNVNHQCPNLKGRKMGKLQKIKKCIVQKTEIEVVKQYPFDNVHGLYRGHDQNKKHWSVNYTFWKTLRNEKSFPFVKVKMFDRMLRDGRSHEFDQCTKKMNSSKWKIF